MSQDKENKTIFIADWTQKKKRELIIKYLEENGIEVTDENIEKVEFDLDFSDELKESLNEMNLDKLTTKEISVSHKYSPEKITISFPDKDEPGCLVDLDIYVDLNGKLQTNLRTFADFNRD
jgi:hypothetical protein